MNKSVEHDIRYRITRSEEVMEDARLLTSNSRWFSCVNRLYYAAFHLVDALLTLDHIQAKSHEGLKTKFFQLYIKNGTIHLDYSKLYSRLFDWRQESDYGVFTSFTEADVLPLLKETADFLKVVKALIHQKRNK